MYIGTRFCTYELLGEYIHIYIYVFFNVSGLYLTDFGFAYIVIIWTRTEGVSGWGLGGYNVVVY